MTARTAESRIQHPTRRHDRAVPQAVPEPTSEEREVLEQLAAVVGGRQPVRAVATLLAEPVRFHMDGFNTTLTVNGWKRWVRYMHQEGRDRDLDLHLDEIRKHRDGTVTGFARWSGRRDGRRLVSDVCSARYRIRDGTIHEIWTSRFNYVFPMGSSMGSIGGLLLTYLRMLWWDAGRRRR